MLYKHLKYNLNFLCLFLEFMLRKCYESRVKFESLCKMRPTLSHMAALAQFDLTDYFNLDTYVKCYESEINLSTGTKLRTINV